MGKIGYDFHASLCCSGSGVSFEIGNRNSVAAPEFVSVVVDAFGSANTVFERPTLTNSRSTNGREPELLHAKWDGSRRLSWKAYALALSYLAPPVLRHSPCRCPLFLRLLVVSIVFALGAN